MSIQSIAKKIISIFDFKFKNIELKYIIIENQPSIKNPTMKSIQNIIMTYFLIKKPKLNIKLISPSLKMKFCKKMNYIKEIPKNYKETKKRSIDVVKNLINNLEINNNDTKNIWNNNKKKDDLSDVLLQSLAFFEIEK